MPRNHTTWAAISVDADQSPPLMLMREERGDLADVYFYRTVLWCKRFCKQGEIRDRWLELSLCLRWPRDEGIEALRDLFRACGVVVGPFDTLWCWEDTNGWIARKYERDRARQEAKRRAGRASAKVRRAAAKKRKADEKAAASAIPAVSTSASKRKLQDVGGWVGRSCHPRSVHGQSTDGKKGKR